MLQFELESISKAINSIHQGIFNKISIGDNMIAYKVPSNNPKKYVIRLDVKINEEG